MLAIVGPTGTGKSRLAIHLAQACQGEIVNADSRQVYCDMDIGTAKPTPEELALVPHHLVDIVTPNEDFSLAQYQELARKAIMDIRQRHRLAMLVGGSGLYVWSLLEGWGIPPVPPDPGFRRILEARAAGDGKYELYHELEQIDPVAAQGIDPRNVRRTIRALEVNHVGTVPFSLLRSKKAPAFKTLIIGLTSSREELYRRIDSRVDGMIDRGLVEETRKLLSAGYNSDMPAMLSIGYRQITLFLHGELPLEEAIKKIKTETRRLIRHQYNWFRLTDKRIQWFDIQDDMDSEIEKLVTKFMHGETAKK
ncbi:tRNA (adenosine(37)-N6)-dimethylallyltransferase MiaA [Chloroflexota bacterium]